MRNDFKKLKNKKKFYLKKLLKMFYSNVKEILTQKIVEMFLSYFLNF